MKRKILIVEPDALVRLGLGTLLNAEPGLEVVASAPDAAAAERLLQETVPDLLICSLSLPDRSGLAFIRAAMRAHQHLQVLVLGEEAEGRCAERALRHGAHGYLVSHDSVAETRQAVHQVLDGHYYLSPLVQDRLYEALAYSDHPLFPSPDEVLSRRELELFELMGCGLTITAIARRMHITPKTAESYRNRAKEKLHAATSADLLFQATRWMRSRRACASRQGCPHALADAELA